MCPQTNPPPQPCMTDDQCGELKCCRMETDMLMVSKRAEDVLGNTVFSSFESVCSIHIVLHSESIKYTLNITISI